MKGGSYLKIAIALWCAVAISMAVAGPAGAEDGGETTPVEVPNPPVTEPPVGEQPTGGEPEPTPPTTTPAEPTPQPPVETPKTEAPKVETPKEEVKAPSLPAPVSEPGGTGTQGSSSPAPAATAPASAASPSLPATKGTAGGRGESRGGGSRHGATVVRHEGAATPKSAAHPGTREQGDPPATSASGHSGSSDPSDSGAAVEAAGTAASEFGEAFSEALPTGPLATIGTHLAEGVGLIPAGSESTRRSDAGKIGLALGTALVGSQVGTARSHSSPPSHPLGISFAPASGGGRAVFLILFWAFVGGLVLFVGIQLVAALGGRTPSRWLRETPDVFRDAAGSLSGDLSRTAGRNRDRLAAASRRAERAAAGLRRLRARAGAGLSGLRSFF